MPYGRKTKEQIHQYVDEAVDFIASQGVKALVVACNTATSVAIQDLRARYDFPILGMEPAVKPAVSDTSCTKRILVTATPVTIREEKLQNLLHQVDQHHQVDLLPLPGWWSWLRPVPSMTGRQRPICGRCFRPTT